ncbi:tripartite tricarboxylate transporter substrate binding protein [Acetomicrobium sp.]|uniref:tripartite tricarboxylate transporter substrate binding protein n=1 Tax=Acetomicrobium sp. TaxID=1872099 RepID=UPI001BD0A484|nr:tripartite tricarboxylate transporter substrate binding protein [Acetomicrobium sp.]
MKRFMAGLAIVLFFVAVFGVFGMMAEAAYPERPITYVIAFNPGGESDITARAQQPYLEKVLGTQIIITYKIGGGGAVAWSEVPRMRPDGYTIVGHNIPHIILQPLQRKDTGYKTTDLKTVCWFEATPNILVVPVDSQFKTLEDFVKYAKEHPGQITLGGSGSYSANHLGTVEFNEAAGIETTYIPFTGSGDAVPAFLGGHVTGLMTYTTMVANYREQMRPLAVATEERVSIFPDVPTFKELGYDYVEGAYRGICVPPKTPDEIVNKLADAFKQVNETPEFKEKMEAMGFQMVFYGPEESEKFVEDRVEYYKSILDKLEMK